MLAPIAARHICARALSHVWQRGEKDLKACASRCQTRRVLESIVRVESIIMSGFGGCNRRHGIWELRGLRRLRALWERGKD